MGLILLLEDNIPSTGKRSAMKIIRNRSNKKETLLTLNNALNNSAQYAYIAYRG